jgi:predicted nucleic acid-binding protein
MMLLVDTSVWSLALRRDVVVAQPEVLYLEQALVGSQTVVTRGLVLQELLQGFSGPKARAQIIDRFSMLPLVQPDRQDHVDAAALRTACRRGGVHIGTIDALLAQLCIRHQLTLLTTDRDFAHAARHCRLRMWRP